MSLRCRLCAMTKSKGVGRGCHLTPERKELLDKLVADGWPLREMRFTHGFGHDVVKHSYPDYCGMSLSDAGKLGRQRGHTDAAIARNHAQPPRACLEAKQGIGSEA